MYLFNAFYVKCIELFNEIALYKNKVIITKVIIILPWCTVLLISTLLLLTHYSTPPKCRHCPALPYLVAVLLYPVHHTLPYFYPVLPHPTLRCCCPVLSRSTLPYLIVVLLYPILPYLVAVLLYPVLPYPTLLFSCSTPSYPTLLFNTIVPISTLSSLIYYCPSIPQGLCCSAHSTVFTHCKFYFTVVPYYPNLGPSLPCPVLPHLVVVLVINFPWLQLFHEQRETFE